MPIFHMSMFKVPAGVIQILESLRSKFFNGHESSGKKASWVQWKKALAPKDNGGLGIFSLYALNRGLIFKWVWRFLAHEPTLWSRVIKAIHGANGKIDEISGKGANSCWINIIKEVRRLEEKGINLLLFMKKKLGNGLSTLFWDDVWCDGGKLKNRFPRAYALENSKQITVGQKLAHPSLYHSFRRHPRGGLELTQVEELAKVINPVVLTQSPDSWSWTLNNSGGYTVASSRNMIDSRLLPKGDLKTRWIRYVPNKVNTFAWKVMTNSLPTRFNISRRGIDIESLSCVNCDVGIETNDHLFFACNTAKKISKLINRWWDVPFMDINSYGEWRSWIDNVKLPKKNKSMFQGLMDEDISSDDDRDQTNSSYDHKIEIKIVLEITKWIKIPNVDKDELRLHVFSESLRGDAKKWWNDEGTTTTWKELKILIFESLYWLASKFDNYWELDKNVKSGLWEFYVNGRTKGTIDDLVNYNEPCDESNKKTCSDLFFKPYLDAQDGTDIYKIIDRDYSPIPIFAHHDISNQDELLPN
ncbi:RNA-directed DNA polymerase, eukaryota, reverse transcriptase zinc-binding domain protein [Tanacetum coccineum]